MYYTLEKLQKEHPIGSVYNIYWNDIYEWCPTEVDVKLFKQKHPNIRNFKQDADGMVGVKKNTKTQLMVIFLMENTGILQSKLGTVGYR